MPFSLSSFAIPIWSFLVVYGAFLAFFLLYTAFNLYHLFRFGTYGIGLYAVMATFTFGTFGVLVISYALLAPYDWTATIPLASLFQGTASVPYFPAQ